MPESKERGMIYSNIKIESQGFCSFCLKPVDEVDTLVRSHGLPICNHCIQTCYTMLLENFPKTLDLSNNGWITK